jgi:Lrp/AsnC family leucine-responsive transcriptional regulator
MKRLRYEDGPLDAVDARIIKTLAEDARISVADILRGLPEVVECDRITGDDCFIAKAHVRSMEHLEKVIDRIIPFAMTNTSIIQSSPVRRRLPAFGEPDETGNTGTKKPRRAGAF